MKVLIACEFSGVVREAFRANGHDAWSCDLLPAEDGSKFHYQMNALDCIYYQDKPWDLMIAHPPCTYLTNAGVRWLYVNGAFGGKQIRDESRWLAMEKGAEFFRQLLDVSIPKIAIENPIPHCYAKQIIGCTYNQLVQPWQFGHGEIKATCLWLKNLPPLKPTNIVTGRHPRVHYASPGPDRWKERSRTLPGIAQAMAEQWGAFRQAALVEEMV